MAKLWPVYEGNRPTVGAPWADFPLPEAIALFELRPTDFVSSLDEPPRFGPADRDLWFAGFKHVIVEVDTVEARRAQWKAGFYKSHLKPKEAFSRVREAYVRLIRQTLVSALGEANVVRVIWEPTTDSQGRGAHKVTVVIKPNAALRLRNGAVLDALVSLRARLRAMGDDRIAMIEYATEAELEQDAGP